MSRLRHRVIQAIMGIVVIGFAYLGWTAVAPYKPAPATDSGWAVENPVSSPSPGAAPTLGIEGVSFARLPVPVGFSQELEVRIVSLPKTAEEFRSLRDAAALTPEGGAALFVLALNAYVKDTAFGEACVTMMLANDPLLLEKADPGAWKGFQPSKNSGFLLKQLLRYAGIARSFVCGTKIADDYALPPLPWTLRVARNKYSALENGDLKVFVYSSGADSRRPLAMRKNDQGVWKVAGFSSLPMPIKTPLPHDPL